MSEKIEERGLTSRLFAIPSAAADALVTQIPSLAKYDLGPAKLVDVIQVMDLLHSIRAASILEDVQEPTAREGEPS